MESRAVRVVTPAHESVALGESPAPWGRRSVGRVGASEMRNILGSVFCGRCALRGARLLRPTCQPRNPRLSLWSLRRCPRPGVSRSPAMAGRLALREARASALCRRCLITRASAKCSSTFKARSWAAWSPATTRSSAESISSGRGSAGPESLAKPGQCALRREDEPHPQRGVHHRLRRRSRAARRSEPRSLRHGRRPQLLQRDQAHRQRPARIVQWD